MIVNVWDWKNSLKIASNKVSSKVKSLSFHSSGSNFVTVGNRHVKFWYLDYSRSSKNKFESLPLMGRSAILGDQRNNYFCDVGCGRGEMSESTYAITKSGLLCEFNNRRLLDKWVELRVRRTNSEIFQFLIIIIYFRLQVPTVLVLLNDLFALDAPKELSDALIHLIYISFARCPVLIHWVLTLQED